MADSPEPWYLRKLRDKTRLLNAAVQKHFAVTPDPAPLDPQKYQAAVDELRRLETEGPDGSAYLEKHIPRLARTLTLIPKPYLSKRVLELGCYMQITPALQFFSGYQEVRGAYYGPLGRTDHKCIFPGGRKFECEVDHFDAERDRFPYPDNHFEMVLVCEMIEHLLRDPMFMLLEIRRVLQDRGRMLITTPNIASIASVASLLEGRDNPQIFSIYTRPQPGEETEIPHVREYTADELGRTVQAAGFEVELLFTENIPEYDHHRHLLDLLQENGYDIRLRGEQTYCMGIKHEDLPTIRFPRWLYVP
jgi:SAM-dependent methyltransferase